MRKIFTSLAVASLMSGAAVPALAQSESWKFDNSHTVIGFSVSHLGFSQTMGSFEEFEGSATLDEENPENSKVEVTIDTASIDSGWDARDEHLRKADFFNVEEYPTMSFVSTSIEPYEGEGGERRAKMTGDLTMLGQTHPVTLDVVLNGMGPHPFADDRMVAGFSARGTLDRTTWGMDAYAPAVGQEVMLVIETELNK